MFVGMFTLLLLSGCNKDTDPVDKDFFIGTYEGSLNYSDTNPDDEKNIHVDNGNIKVVKVGKSYNFIISDGIPDITNIKFEESGENTVISIGSDESHYIKINGSQLKIMYVTGSESWTADCTRK